MSVPVSSLIRAEPTVALTIAACAAAALLLRLYELSRPGNLLGVTEYDDGVLFGNALRLVSGAVPYRDFAVVQPPGSMLLMAPVALLAKVTGTAWGLAIARLLTVCADTANVILLGLLVRHRGPLTVGVACGLYAVYPDALVGAHTFLLEPWLNLCCLAGAVLVFDGDRMAGTATRAAGNRRLALGGAAFGFAVTVKIWGLLPLALAGLLLAVTARRVRPVGALAGGAALGMCVPLLPFAVLAPGALVRDVLVGQLVRNADGSRDLGGRLADLAGLQLLPAAYPRALLLPLIGALIVGLYVAGYLARNRRPAVLDAYALLGAVAVTAMLLWPRLYYSHYGAFEGPFLALAVALPAGLLTARPDEKRAAEAARPAALPAAVAAVLVTVLVAMGIGQFRAERGMRGIQVSAAADRLIRPGACVVTNDAPFTVAADRFFSSAPGCPAMVDPFGTLFAMTGGDQRGATAAMLRPVITLWQATLEHAGYVWLVGATVAQIPWNAGLDGYFRRHFRLIGFAGQATAWRDVPRPGLYVRT
jgi:cytochrome bd-type quinol oxidase subunit 2